MFHAFVLVVAGFAMVANGYDYKTLKILKICEPTKFAEPVSGDANDEVIQGTYSPARTTPDNVGMYFPLMNDQNDWEFNFGSNTGGNKYGFTDGTDCRIKFPEDGPNMIIEFFKFLYQEFEGNNDDTDCDSATVGNGGCQLFDVSNNNSLWYDDNDHVGFENDTIYACAVFSEEIDPNRTGIVDPAEDNSTIPLGEWQCNRESSKACHELSLWLGIEYKGFEAIADLYKLYDGTADGVSNSDGKCKQVARRFGNYKQGIRCDRQQCVDGYRQFVSGSEDRQDAIFHFHRCYHVDTYFPNCNPDYISPRGCKQCDPDLIAPTGYPYTLKEFTLPTWGNYCPYGFCYDRDTDLSIDTLGSDLQVPSPTYGDWGPKLCWTQDQRIMAEDKGYTDPKTGEDIPAVSLEKDKYYKNGRFFVADPWNITECRIGAVQGIAVYCIEDGLCDHDATAGCHEDGSCSQCLGQPYDNFKLSRFHRCQNVEATFGGGCILGNEGYGCGQCVTQNEAPIYSEASDVWFCEESDIPENPEQFRLNSQDKPYSPWVCPQFAEYDPNDNVLFIVDNEGQEFGIDCFGDEMKGGDRDDNCVDCPVFGSLCGQCATDTNNAANDYFRPTDFHRCTNCQETFGFACERCQDYRGCAQCADGYILQYDSCCGLWYCI